MKYIAKYIDSQTYISNSPKKEEEDTNNIPILEDLGLHLLCATQPTLLIFLYT